MMIKYLKIIIIFLFFQYLLIHKTYAYTVFGDMTCGTILEKENDSTYNFGIKKWMQGYFSGRGVGFNEGVRQAGSRQGVFRREGAIMKFWSLDDVTDGNMNYCETIMNLETENVEMTFYPF